MIADDPDDVTGADVSIARTFSRNPFCVGVELRKGLYLFVESPLAAFYSIDDDAHVVTIETNDYRP